MIALFIIISLIILASRLQRKTRDMMAGFIFIFPVVAHELTGPYMNGWAYYVSDITLGLLSIRMLTMLKWSELSEKLSVTVLVSMILNILGFCMWYNYLSTKAYNMVFLIFYSWVLYIMISKGGVRVGLAETIRNNIGIFRNALSRVCVGGAWKD